MNSILNEILHEAGQMLLFPCLAMLVFFIVASIWQAGTVIIEYILEQRKVKEDIPTLLQKIHTVPEEELYGLIENTNLLKRHKEAILEVIKSKDMPKESLVTLAKTILNNEEKYLDKSIRPTDLIAKLGPMFGLLGTLIPLGPGIVALGQGDTELLSISMSTAFDTTIAGVISAAVCYVISKIRKCWYENYINSMEAILECMIQEVTTND